MAKRPKESKCRACGNYFLKTWSSTQIVCSMKCAIAFSKKNTEKKRKQQAKSDRLQRRERLQQLKSRADWLKDLQAVFNKFIRLRDKDLPCISCGRYHSGQYHAGHYRSVGACPVLRFDENNVHKQCSVCNNHKSGNITEYRINLVRKLGTEEVERLEQHNHPPLKLTIDEIKALITVYKGKVKELSDGE